MPIDPKQFKISKSMLIRLEQHAATSGDANFYSNHELRYRVCHICGGFSFHSFEPLPEGQPSVIKLVSIRYCDLCLSVQSQQPNLFEWTQRVVENCFEQMKLRAIAESQQFIDPNVN
jgi:hypothetical protein